MSTSITLSTIPSMTASTRTFALPSLSPSAIWNLRMARMAFVAAFVIEPFFGVASHQHAVRTIDLVALTIPTIAVAVIGLILSQTESRTGA